jgi:histidinol-phosphate aminotransferase
VGEGIDGLLGYLVRLLVEPGDAVVTSDGAYPTFNYHVAGFGGELHKVPYTGDREDPQALIAKAADRRQAHLLRQSRQPDGQLARRGHRPGDDRRAARGRGAGAGRGLCRHRPEGAIPPLDLSHPRVIRFRTFSKAYGLAGLRVGYGPGSARARRRLQPHPQPFRGRPAWRRPGPGGAGRSGAPDACRGDIAAARDRIGEIARDNGLTPLPSATNFVTDRLRSRRGFRARRAAGLVARGIFVRMPFTPPQDRCIRVSCGPARRRSTPSRRRCRARLGMPLRGTASRARDLPSRVGRRADATAFREVHMLTRFTLAAVLATALLPGAAPAQTSPAPTTRRMPPQAPRPARRRMPSAPPMTRCTRAWTSPIPGMPISTSPGA